MVMSVNQQTRQWVKEAVGGDAVAVSKLLATYHPVLRSHVDAGMDPALRARTEPEDILQQAYVEVYRAIGRFEERDPASFVNWVLTIVDHKLTDAGRAMRRQMRDVARERKPAVSGGTSSHLDLLDQLYADSDTPSRILRRDEAVGAMLACISQLSDAHREVVRLRFLDGRSVMEVAERLNKSPAAVVAMTKRALEALRSSMDRMGEFTHGG